MNELWMTYCYSHQQRNPLCQARRFVKSFVQKRIENFSKEMQLFKTELQYMGNTIFVKDSRVCLKPLRSIFEAIQKLKPPTMAKDYRSFARVVNFMIIFCPELQKLLKPIYDLTRKGRHFIWGEEQQTAFVEIKSQLQKPPVLSMPDRKGRFYCILTLANMPLVALCIKFKMVNPNSLHMQVRECLRQQRITLSQIWKCVV